MRKYAEGTEVSVDRSLSELKGIINRFGASDFAYYESGSEVRVIFGYNDLRVMFRMQLPSKEPFMRNSYGNLRTQSAIETDWEKECRRVWRALTAVVKAKLVAVTEDISTFEQEFLAFIVLPGEHGFETVGDRLIPEVKEIARTGNLPPLMGGPRVIALQARNE